MNGEPTPGFNTRAVHAGGGFSGTTGAVMPPVFMTSTFRHGNLDGFDYTRSGNPNFRMLDEAVATMEGGEFATSFASGVSAITAIVSTLRSGDLVLAEENVYGCTYRLFDRVFEKFGVAVEYADFADEGNWEVIRERGPALVWIESPTNPLLKVIDIAGISRVARETGSALVMDNTFASPFLQTPLALGATLSLSSTTKYINGHSDALGGTVATSDPAWHEKLVFAQKALGLQPSPFDAWLTLRGLRTLGLRMERHSANALALATWMERHPRFRRVRYPFLESHPQQAIARRQMKLGSGLIVAELEASVEESFAFCRALRHFTLAESLGGVESLVCHPATMTHASVPKARRLKVGISDGLIRFSVGIEDLEDLTRDLSQALQSIGR